MKINEPALAALLFSKEGAVGRQVTRKSLEVRGYARRYAQNIMHRMPDADLIDVLENIDFEQDGVTSVIGIKEDGKVEDYLADKESRELAWLFPAAQDAFPIEK